MKKNDNHPAAQRTQDGWILHAQARQYYWKGAG